MSKKRRRQNEAREDLDTTEKVKSVMKELQDSHAYEKMMEEIAAELGEKRIKDKPKVSLADAFEGTVTGRIYDKKTGVSRPMTTEELDAHQFKKMQRFAYAYGMKPEKFKAVAMRFTKDKEDAVKFALRNIRGAKK